MYIEYIYEFILMLNNKCLFQSFITISNPHIKLILQMFFCIFQSAVFNAEK